jgi:hypothetical protein
MNNHFTWYIMIQYLKFYLMICHLGRMENNKLILKKGQCVLDPCGVDLQTLFTVGHCGSYLQS